MDLFYRRRAGGEENPDTYPEPDDVPNYPWLGSKAVHEARIPSPLNAVENITPETSLDNIPVTELEAAIDDEMGQSAFPVAPFRDRNDSLADPDFEMSEESEM